LSLSFTIKQTDGAARRGQLMLAHGTVDTPAFMPVGTAATVKGMMPDAVAGTGAQIILGNTYHLMLRPGSETVERLGGLHKFMNWPGPIQRQLDADITMQFDECIAWPAEEADAKRAMELSLRWAERCRKAFTDRPGYGLFGINQGGTFPALRAQSAKGLIDIGFDGYAVGGLAVGEGQELMFATLDSTVPHLPADKPRYLMGVGTPADIVGAVRRGIDMFDCVMPTRSGRTGKGFTRRGEINIRNARHARDPRPLDAECRCPACADHSRAYLHHLFKADEMLGPILLTWHNIQFYQDLMKGLRGAIKAGGLEDFAAGFIAKLDQGDIAPL
jgi:queuine tRNA-ribosyltransferase